MYSIVQHKYSPVYAIEDIQVDDQHIQFAVSRLELERTMLKL
jgi:hypothetical protein